jgi:hypothetical protein
MRSPVMSTAHNPPGRSGTQVTLAASTQLKLVAMGAGLCNPQYLNAEPRGYESYRAEESTTRLRSGGGLEGLKAALSRCLNRYVTPRRVELRWQTRWPSKERSVTPVYDFRRNGRFGDHHDGQVDDDAAVPVALATSRAVALPPRTLSCSGMRHDLIQGILSRTYESGTLPARGRTD